MFNVAKLAARTDEEQGTSTEFVHVDMVAMAWYSQ